MANIELKCCICEATFQPGVLNEAGKCPTCEVEYPTAKDRKAAMSLNQPELHMGSDLTVDRVREIVREELGKGLVKSDMSAKATPDKANIDKSTLSKYAETLKETVKANKNKETK